MNGSRRQHRGRVNRRELVGHHSARGLGAAVPEKLVRRKIHETLLASRRWSGYAAGQVNPPESDFVPDPFEGFFHLDLDRHGRLTFPEPWRHPSIRKGVILVKLSPAEGQDFLRGYDPREFMRGMNTLRQDPVLGDYKHPVWHHLGLNSYSFDFDPKWRIDLSEYQLFRDLFQTEVTLIGHRRRFEIRTPEDYREGLSHFETDGSSSDLL